MSYIVGGVKAKKVGVLLEPSTYDADITPENMQHGMTAYARGEKVVGTGKCFEFAGYGSGKIQLLQDGDGNNKYGLSIISKGKPNLIFLSSTGTGDIILQTNHIVDLAGDTPVVIGTNYSASGKVTATHKNGRLIIYLENTESQSTRLRYFFGKDNEI